MRYYESVKQRSYAIEVHIADIHFGSTDPAKQYTILNEQFLQKIAMIDFDILSIDGDIFDKKFNMIINSEEFKQFFEKIKIGICPSKLCSKCTYARKRV